MDGPRCQLSNEPQISFIPCFAGKLWPIFSFLTAVFGTSGAWCDCVWTLILYKGHEGRGAGLCNTIKAYEYHDQHSTKTHVDARQDI